jgi:putative DNA primase/helicase
MRLGLLAAMTLIPTPPVARLLSSLKGVQERDGYWVAFCPSHDDKKRSLSVTVGDDGRALVKCHAGVCDWKQVAAGAGLEESALFADERKGNGRPFVPTPRPVLVKSYDYHDADGTLLFQTCRYEPKDFKQRRPDGDEWIYNLKGITPVLYHLPDIRAAVESGNRVFVVEGEKDADTLTELGYVATTAPMGAGKWKEQYSETLAGAEVIIIPDNDPPGRKHVEQIATSLKEKDCAVRVLDLPNLPAKGDVSDWLEAGNTLDALEALIGKTRLFGNDVRTKKLWRLDEILSDDEIMRPPPPIIPRLAWHGRSTLIASAPKSGKSTLTGYLAAQTANGGQFLGDPCRQGDVLILGLEEALGDIGRRLRHFGANPQRVHVVHEMPTDPSERPKALIDYIARIKPLLVIVDTLIAYGRGMIESENDAMQMQAVIQEMSDVAHRTDTALFVNHHTAKAGGPRGSGAIIAGVDTVVEISIPDKQRDHTLRKAECMGRMPTADFEYRYDGREYLLANEMGLPLIQKVLSFVRANPNQSLKMIRERIGGRSELVDIAVDTLVKRGFVYDTGDAAGHSYEASMAAPAKVA